MGILRTLPAADPKAVARLRRTALALGIDWPGGLPADAPSPARPGRAPAGCRPRRVDGAAPRLGYEAFDDDAPPGRARRRRRSSRAYDGAAAAPRRPLRRGDLRLHLRQVGSARVGAGGAAAAAGADGDVRTSRAQLVRSGGHLDGRGLGARIRVGEVLYDVVWNRTSTTAAASCSPLEPAVTANCAGDLPLGERVRVRLTLADVPKRQIRFELA